MHSLTLCMFVLSTSAGLASCVTLSLITIDNNNMPNIVYILYFFNISIYISYFNKYTTEKVLYMCVDLCPSVAVVDT